MLLQSKKVWIADQFIPAQIEIDDNKIKNNIKYIIKWLINNPKTIIL